MSVDRARILGNALSWASWIVKVEGHEFHGVKKISGSQKRERGRVMGTGRANRPRGLTGGKYTPEFKMTVYRGSMNDLIKFLAARAPDGVSYGNVKFDIIGQQVEQDETPTTVHVLGCYVVEETFEDSDDSIEGSADDVGLMVTEIRRNGATLYDNTRL